jgi:methylmalonyl-CoA/ethylmalonyl-CoA epimerase
MKKPVFTQVLQICVVVDDIDAYMRRYNDDYGIGPWIIYDFNKDTVSNMTICGKKVDYSMKIALCDFHNVQWELIEPTSDNSIYAEFLKKNGPGLHHIAFATENYEETIQDMADRENHEIQGGNFHGLTYTYLDTNKDLGFIAEIYNTPEGFEFPAPLKTYPPQK